MIDNSTVSFNIDFLKESSRKIAEKHSIASDSKIIRQVKPILEDSKHVLNEAYKTLSRLAKKDQEISPAAEWLIDNFYIIQEQIVQVEYDFPKEFQRSIPSISEGEFKGMPRIYELVLNLINHTDNLVNVDVLAEYVQSYQEVRTLKQGEIWAIPIMVRLILIQNLASKAKRILYRKKIRSDAFDLIKKLDENKSEEPGTVTNQISSWLNNYSNKTSDPIHLVELFNRLQSSGYLYDEQKRWFNYKVRQYDLTLEEALRIEAQMQSRIQVSIQNAVSSLRYTSETDWQDFAEECSMVDQVLRLDPAGYYPLMDFQTRDRYRKVVEQLSRRSNHSETEISEQVLLMAEKQSNLKSSDPADSLHNPDLIKQHVGYYLIGDGYPELVHDTGYKIPLKERVNMMLEQKTSLYLMAIGLHTCVLLAILWIVTGAISDTIGMSVALLLIAFFPALDLSISAVNRFFAFFLPPRVLPKMEYEDGIPDSARTMVVVPTMFSSPGDVRRQFEFLEIRSLANTDSSLQFALLSDFTDADEKHLEGDQAILDAASDAIRELNKKYNSRFGDKFFLLHRERLWNESENAWMGWERKRGKLEEFNRLLCNPSEKSSYSMIKGNFIDSIQSLPVQYVITLDSDTKLPPDSARDLVRTISHPLNKAWYNPEVKRITRGYGVIQPRISIPPESARKTWFSRIFSGNVGIDPYSTAVSDIYQDLTGEAVFTGKGIYDVRAFHTVLDNQFPENKILSHDLIESTYVRTGLATDIELYDDYPSTYASFSNRNHRWARGDWQIASWLFSEVPSADGNKENTINLLSKWKIFDNLRRTLNPFFLMFFFIAGWFWLPGNGWIWTAAAFGILAFPIYVTLSSDLLNRPARVRWKLYVDKVRANLKINTIQSVFALIILPHQAITNLDAIFRSLYRIKISKKWLLEWRTASQTERSNPNSLRVYLQSMFVPVLLAIAILIVAVIKTPQYLWIVVPFFLIWGGSPVYLWYVSQPLKSRETALKESDLTMLRMVARRTWFYFERFVNEEHSCLPPDNYQEEPPLKPVDRTSPTNIGLALVSTKVAYNMGFITFGELLERVNRTLESMSQLERYQGHFYNWYDIKLGEILSPRYVSTVDSGNLAAGLIVIKEAVKKEMKKRGVNRNIWHGIRDTTLTVREIFDEYRINGDLSEGSSRSLVVYTSSILEKLKRADSEEKIDKLELLRSLKEDATSLNSINLLPLGSRLADQQMEDLYYWLDSPLRQIEKTIDEFRNLTFPEEIEFDKYSVEELHTLVENQKGYESTEKILKKWKKQADEAINTCEKFISEMDFSFLYLKKRGLFSIGYNVEKAQLDKGTYDLLASEARIASYIAIAKADIPVEHWFRLSRRLTSLSNNEILLSWGGTMFEYLMPMLFMRSYPDTLISHTCENVVKWQREYGESRNQPWGFSESAYYFLNIEMHYQYRAFGAPGLGLKRGLAEEYVVAPYATLLSLMVDKEESLDNLQEIRKIGGLGLHGFYDAIDFTPSRLQNKQTHHLVKTYMAHHHGMAMIAIENMVNNWSVHDYFHSDPRVQGCELILQERIPRGIPIKEPHPIEVELESGEPETDLHVVEHVGMDQIDRSPPRVHLLSNGKFSTAVSQTGSGASKINGIVLNGWEADPTTDPLGMYFYVRDLETGTYWSSMHQPVKRKPDRYDCWYHNGKIVTSRVDEWIETTTEICVSPDDAMELRKITLTNYSDRKRTLEVTSYAEVVLNRMQDHRSHPAFSKLFVQTDYLAEHHALVARRRPRSEGDDTLWLIHTYAGREQEDLTEPLQYETERSTFIGRGRSLNHPAAMDNGVRLKGTLGNVSDPVVSLRKKFTLGPGEKVQFTFGLGFAKSREEAIKLADIYDNQHATNRVFDLAEVYSSVELNHLGITSKQAHYFQKLASYFMYSNHRFRAGEKHLAGNRKKQRDLWVYGISGDLPLIIFRMNDVDQLKGVKTILKAQTFWRMKGLETELLLLNDHPPSYADEVQEAIQQSIETSMDREYLNKYGGVFVQRTDKMPDEDLMLLLSVAHAVFDEKLPDLSQSRPEPDIKSWINDDVKVSNQPVDIREKETSDASPADPDLLHFNGYGGFSESGDEYHILIRPDQKSGCFDVPPAPWINVISNPNFGFTVSERGAGYTWSQNSRENKLTSWSNDPVQDPYSEAFYIRDEASRNYWSPAPGPVPGSGDYRVIHGFGYTKFIHQSENLEQELVQFVPEKDAVKISKLTITNKGSDEKKLSVFRYLDRVLGIDRLVASRFVISEFAEKNRTLFASNHYNNEFAGRTVYATVLNSNAESELKFTTNRTHFIGRNRSLSRPLSLSGFDGLNNEVVVGGDPCAAFQMLIQIAQGETVTLYFLEGESRSRKEAETVIEKYNEPEQIESQFEMVKEYWRSKLTRIQVQTPDSSVNKMLNGWLMYQNLSSRMWARTAFYQAGGAFGFRDQLQDSMAAFYVDSKLTRQQLLLHAANQFSEGDVLHWWHPPTGRGIRSKITDDRLWLPYVTDFYIESTGDFDVLKEEVPYITARELEDYEHEVYLKPEISNESGTLYDHCCKAIEISLKFGEHGLPLMGAGDWNDGMNRVGEHGKGESVWLGFFMYGILVHFVKICKQMDDPERAKRYQEKAKELKSNLNKHGWDGEWYLRAYYDDGAPLGSAENDECKIDAISQAWAVISGVASEARGKKALESVEKHLISEHDKIIRLLTPPFDKTEKNPGYIKGYIPGVRENGGQYTHGALWVIKALAESGLGDKAVKYLRMINPVNHALNREQVMQYKVEPYVVAADVYGEQPLTGMGGWTWYTGSGGWMYRVILESILGLRLEKEAILLNPSISGDWPGYSMSIVMEDGKTVYNIEIENPEKLQTGCLQGKIDDKFVSFDKKPARISVKMDGSKHNVKLKIVGN
jgi:cyclic beta-1,2-glucan synthetase